MKHIYKLRNSAAVAVMMALIGLSASGSATESGMPAIAKDETTSVADSTAVTDEVTDLDELVVVERQKLVKSDGATLTYNVTEDPEAGSANTLDILRKVPGVTVDAQENVKVNGQSNFKILLDGREDPMLSGDLKTILKSMPAATIKKIEVISEPGAKYDAEGVGGVLNIVTDRRQKLSGFMGQVGAWINNYQAGGYVNARTKVGNVMLDANVSYNNGKFLHRKQETEKTYESLDDSENHLLTDRQTIRNGWDYTGVKLGMSWEPDTLNLFTLSMNYGYNSWRMWGEQDRTMQRRDLTTLWALHRNTNYEGDHNGVGAQLSFQHNFRQGHYLIASYGLDYAAQDNNQDYESRYTVGSGYETPFSRDNTKGAALYQIMQLDYSNRFSERHLVEAGGKISLNTNMNHNTPYMGETAETMEMLAALELKMDQLKNVYALYGSYTGTFAKWNIKAGLRYEYTYMGIKYKIGDYDNFSTRLHDVVPNAAISYNISTASSLRLAYQMRISRPHISQINPYVNILNPGQISYGNPDLKSEKGHTFSLGYSNYEGKITGSAKLTYRYVNNGVNDVILMRDGILNSTYANIGVSHRGMLDVSADWNISAAWRWSVYASGSYCYMKAESEMLTAKNHGWQTSVSTNLNYTSPSKWRMSIYGGLWTPWYDLQGRGTKTSYYYSVSASKSWLKDDALTVQVSAGNFLPTHNTMSYIQEDPTVKLRYRSRYSQWNLGLGISFKFGGLNASMKQTAASIEKEESSSTGGNK